MKAVVLAGGYATRLWPITRQRPKMLLPLGTSTVLDPTLEKLQAQPNIDRIYLSTNERFASDFRQFLSNRDYEKVQLSIEPTASEAEKKGVINALLELIKREGIDDDLLVIGGDNLFSFSLATFLRRFEERSTPLLAAYDVGSTDLAQSYGVLELADERVISFEEKPEDPASTLVSIACYAFPVQSLPLLETYLENGNNPDEPGWFIKWMHDQQPVYAYGFDGHWFDVGTQETYLDAVEVYQANGPTIAPDAHIENSDIGPDVIVKSGVTIKNSTISKSVIFQNVTIEDATIENALIDEDVTLSTIEICGSRLGVYSTLTGLDGPYSHR